MHDKFHPGPGQSQTAKYSHPKISQVALHAVTPWLCGPVPHFHTDAVRMRPYKTLVYYRLSVRSHPGQPADSFQGQARRLGGGPNQTGRLQEQALDPRLPLLRLVGRLGLRGGCVGRGPVLEQATGEEDEVVDQLRRGR
jgi:hypothetical protein